MKILFCSSSVNISSCPVHSHDCFELVVVTSGECTTVTDSNDYFTPKNTILLLPPKISHSTTCENRFSDTYIQFDSCPFPVNEPLLVHDYTSNIARLSKILKRTYIKKETGYMNICSGLLDSIFDFILAFKNVTYSHDFVASLKDAIVDNVSNTDFNINDAILKTGYNSDYVRRCFKKDMGMTPNEYFISLKMDSARKLLLLSPQMTIFEVAMRCGFTDQYYFSGAFSKAYGCSPSSFRKSQK